MKRKIWIIITACLAAVLIAAACLIGWAAHRGIGISEALYIETDNGHMVLLQGSPVSVSGKDGMFDGLTMGDRVWLVHGLVAESYPGRTRGYLCVKRADGTQADISAPVLQSLREMGWLPMQPPASSDDAIAIADAYKRFDYHTATAELDPQTGDWTVTLWSGDREIFQVIIVGSDGSVKQAQEASHWTNAE